MTAKEQVMNHLASSQLGLSAEIQKRQMRNRQLHSDHPLEQQAMHVESKQQSSIRKLFSALINRRRNRQSTGSQVPSLKI